MAIRVEITGEDILELVAKELSSRTGHTVRVEDIRFEIKHRYTGGVLWTVETAPEEADLAGVNLAGANLAGASLAGANLTRANLTRAHLTGANLTGANLTGANLTGVDFTEAKKEQP